MSPLDLCVFFFQFIHQDWLFCSFIICSESNTAIETVMKTLMPRLACSREIFTKHSNYTSHWKQCKFGSVADTNLKAHLKIPFEMRRKHQIDWWIKQLHVIIEEAACAFCATFCTIHTHIHIMRSVYSIAHKVHAPKLFASRFIHTLTCPVCFCTLCLFFTSSGH